MVLGSYVQQSLCVNPPANLTRKQDKLASQGPARKFNFGSDEAFTKAFIPLKALIPPLVLFPIKDLFTKFIKAFMEST